MIGRLRGIVVEESATGEIVIETGGVGYDVLSPLGTVQRSQTLSSSPEIILYIHSNIREDAFELFGFASPEERGTFRALVSVHGVGPKLAISVLNVFPEQELGAVIEAEDKARLNRVPGVGKKTAERLVLELRGKLITGTQAAGASATVTSDNQRLLSALTSLGYRSVEAERVIKKLSPEELSGELSQQIRTALSLLAP